MHTGVIPSSIAQMFQLLALNVISFCFSSPITIHMIIHRVGTSSNCERVLCNKRDRLYFGSTAQALKLVFSECDAVLPLLEALYEHLS